MKTIIAACSQNLSGSRASIQTALRTLLVSPWPSRWDVRSWLQLLSVLQWVLSFLLLGAVSLLLLIYLVFTSFWPISALYLAWIIFDWDTPEKGGRRLPCLRRWPVWRHFRDYFPVKPQLHHRLPPPRHPLRRRLLQLHHRLHGLRGDVPGHPALPHHPGRQLPPARLQGVPDERGAHLVPSFSFGENDLFRQVVFEEGSWMRSIQQRFQKIMGFAPCVFYGRGLTSVQSWGFLPYPRPITTVVGEPVMVPKIENPSPEVVDMYHEMYISSLLKLFHENKTKYGLSETDELHIL
ncbi:diacylglycerol O-acyltransferase 2-like isoform X7 [Apus apus]|uniref:diacylglycerol O-acyltransferase 2-like isoform X7 n=1 Tax=Apus apus TaxID=8895 RepID=UPI0021F88068|nr:diacylglycerol O-acyltransferase 2-like isoform X7 [Apus apus]